MTDPDGAEPDGAGRADPADPADPAGRADPPDRIGTAGAGLAAAHRLWFRERRGPVVTLEQGKVRGWRVGDTTVFRNLPYAEPPVGRNRFRPPGPPPRWSGVRNGAVFAPEAPQASRQHYVPRGVRRSREDEDCLYLNVHVPTASSAPRPVMVWIHGGAFENGSGSSREFEPTRLALLGDVVVVTINYRLGVLGWLHLGHLDPDLPSAGNNGLLDQIAALRWVRHNIAAFGGDPHNVTVFGNSAGAMSITAMLCLPEADDLFGRAIVQSGAGHFTRSLERAEGFTAQLLDTVGATTVDDLRRLDLPALMQGQRDTVARLGFFHSVEPRADAFLELGPVVDGVLLKERPIDTLRGGGGRTVPMIIGSQADEWGLAALLSPPKTDAELDKLLRVLFRRQAQRVRAVYAEANGFEPEGGDPTKIHATLITDRFFTMPALELADAMADRSPDDTFVYLFRYSSSKRFGAIHGKEVAYVFGHTEPWKPEMVGGRFADADRKLVADAVGRAWTSFARDGDPRVGRTAGWPAWDADHRALVFDSEPVVEVHPFADRLRWWERRL